MPYVFDKKFRDRGAKYQNIEPYTLSNEKVFIVVSLDQVLLGEEGHASASKRELYCSIAWS